MHANAGRRYSSSRSRYARCRLARSPVIHIFARESARDVFVRMATGSDRILMSFDQSSELVEWFQPLHVKLAPRLAKKRVVQPQNAPGHNFRRLPERDVSAFLGHSKDRARVPCGPRSGTPMRT
jgi:hypothetical protein